MAGNSAIFKRANVLMKQGHDRKQAFAIAYAERDKDLAHLFGTDKPKHKAARAKKNPAKPVSDIKQYVVYQVFHKDNIEKRTESRLSGFSTKKDAVDFARRMRIGKSFEGDFIVRPVDLYGPLDIVWPVTRKAIKKNPVKRKTRAVTQKAAVSYVNRPSQITKKSPTKRLRVRRTKNLRVPVGVFPNPSKSRNEIVYVIHVLTGGKILGFLTQSGKVTTELAEAWQFPTKSDAEFYAKKAFKKGYEFKVYSITLFHRNPIAEKTTKREKRGLFEQPEFPFRVESSTDGNKWRAEGSFRTEMIAREYARALDRKSGGRVWIRVTE